MPVNLPNMLSIAGFDPSGGAGLLADIKTAEAHKTYGFGVCSALTFQNDTRFEAVEWVSAEKIIRQIEVLTKRFEFHAVKIGLIENTATLENVLDFLLSLKPGMPIVCDPVLKASAGFEFHPERVSENWLALLPKITLLTPNFQEFETIFNNFSFSEIREKILRQNWCSVLLKGGHSPENKGTDILFAPFGESRIEGKNFGESQKHGSGCVLSSAIASNLAKGFDLQTACQKAKKYIHGFLKSTPGLLGTHFFLKNDRTQ